MSKGGVVVGFVGLGTMGGRMAATRAGRVGAALVFASAASAIFLLVSVRKHFESFESFVIQSGDLIREGHHDVDGEEPRTLRPQQIAISE